LGVYCVYVMENHNGDLERNYTTDFSATQVKELLNSEMRMAGSELETPIKSVEMVDEDKERFKLQMRPTVDKTAGEILGASRINRDGFKARVLGFNHDENTAIVTAEKANRTEDETTDDDTNNDDEDDEEDDEDVEVVDVETAQTGVHSAELTNGQRVTVEEYNDAKGGRVVAGERNMTEDIGSQISETLGMSVDYTVA